MKILFLIAGLSLMPVLSLAEQDAKAPGGEAVPLNRCFCGRLTGIGYAPYTIDRVKSAPPACASLKDYDIETQHFWEDGLVECDVLEKCDKGLKKYEEKRKALEAKTAEAQKKLEACCALPKEELSAALPCSNKRGKNWGDILKVLAAETEKLDKAEAAARGRCLAKSQKLKDEDGKVKPGGK